MFERSIDDNISHIMEWISCKATGAIESLKDGCMTYISTIDANLSAKYR